MNAPALAPRLLRAAVFTAVCVVLSALGHALAACAGIAPWALVAGFLGIFGITVLLAGRERSLGFVVATLTGGQLTLHVLFGLGQRRLTLGPEADDVLVRMAARLVCGAGGASLTPVDATRIVRDAGLDPTGAVTGAGAHPGHLAAAGSPAGELLPGLPMLLGHLLAALATGWLLRRGDRALVRLVELSEQGATELAEHAVIRSLRAALRLVRALLAGLAATPGTGPARAVRTAFASSPPPVAEALQHTVIRRGPPAADCVLAA
ncbi:MULTISPECIES: hypothetical protein [unclassified Streptomyces]|uniref:hypothetical protein n=1 Tax=unclassified Streptomyces TaxID=2593676 RepID=UPI001660AC5E|nr:MULTISPECIES: hypothetical protein [unclassified Streptomyces]MBD0710309.1 hypothetical protein [Streptomyces sp. CBMA291]MBD0717434.1 hypothetical protein [Streptomyces sp. CBMA370]